MGIDAILGTLAVRLDVTYSQFRRCIGLGAPVIVSFWPCTCCLLLACSIPQRYWSVHLYSVTCVEWL